MESKEEEEVEDGVVTTRIFVGGLGESVTAGDLEKTFSSLGVVRGLDIVRTNGRSFAYIDFQPSSHNSLSKLFSKYNGCMWKGGRLRLEKAREHYLVRLKREWVESAEVPQKPKNDLVADINIATSEKSKLLNPEKMQLQIFFPRLRKVKPLPYSGTGKHKYSFQRIEVPSMPIHFCDCEEHCDPSETAKGKQVSTLEGPTGEINEEELNMMRSVMNKIFKKEVNSRSAYSETSLATEGDKPNQSVEDVPFDATVVDQDSDADNLVINMVSGGSSRFGLVEAQRWATISEDQESKFRKRQLINDGPTQSKLKAQKRKNTGDFNSSDTTSKKPQLLLEDESNINEFTPTKHKKEKSESHSEESKVLKPARPTEQKPSIDQSTIGKAWRQKSSWREMVGHTANSSFSISHILPDTGTKHNWHKSNGLDIQSPNDRKQHNLMKQSRNISAGDSSEGLGHGKDEILQENITAPVGTSISPSETTSKESEGPKEATPTDGKASNHQTTGGNSWIQKSSWRELVGETDNNSFSISHILPDTAKIRNIPKANSSVPVNSIEKKHQNLTKQQLRSKFIEDGSNDSDAGKDGIMQHEVTAPSVSNVAPSPKEYEILAGLDCDRTTVDQNSQNEKRDNSTSSKPSENKSHWWPNKKVMGEASIGEVCTFMRSAASEREWVKTKAALSGALKKKSNDK